MRRREFIAGLGAAAWPVVARAQQPAVPVIGYLSSASLETASREVIAGVRRGLSEAGYVVGRNVAFEYRWAEYHYDRLPALADDLARLQVAVIVAPGAATALAAKAATKSVPIVFGVGGDPVEAGLVASLSRPGGNLTGISGLTIAVASKRLELLHELVPAATLIGYLVNPANQGFAETETRELEAAARLLGVHMVIVNASHPNEFEAAFATLVLERAGGLVVSSEALFFSPDELVALAARHAVPAIYPTRTQTAVGGLMSYGTDFADEYRQIEVYTGRILKGEKPADLPVQQVTKMQLAINMNTAKALGLTIPETLLATADEVIQ